MTMMMKDKLGGKKKTQGGKMLTLSEGAPSLQAFLCILTLVRNTFDEDIEM